MNLSCILLNFDAMLQFINVNLELFTDHDKYLFIERCIRGGINNCITRYAKTNNPLLDDQFSKTDQ